MLVIRLSRTGKSKQPQYRIVVQEHTQDPWAPAQEVVGTFNPRTEPKTLELKKDRIEFWLSKGAKPSATLHNIFVDEGIIKGEKQRTISITKKRAAGIAEKKVADEEAKKKAEEAAKPAEAAAPVEAAK